MKKTIATIALLFICYISKAQITLDYTFPYKTTNSGQVILFSVNGTKILMNDTATNQVKLYNTDYTLWKTINVPSYALGYRFISTALISDNLFNSDALVELVASYYYYSAGIFPYYNYKSQIINETGAVVQDLGNTMGVQLHVIDGLYKLYAIQYNFDTLPFTPTYTFNIYSLPGTMPCGQCGGLGVEKVEHQGGGIISAPIPNPSNETVKIFYTLPESVEHGTLTIYNNLLQMVNTYQVNSANKYITLDNSNLPSGVYYYNISGAGITPMANKMILVK